MADVPLIDIRPDHWEIVRVILHAHVPQHEVWAFGSRATWQAKPYSDLDLAILMAEPLPLALSAALADAFSEAELPWRVDVLDWATTSAAFRAIVQRDKVVVQQKSMNVKSLWRRYQVSNLINDKVLVIGDGYRAKNSELSTQGLPFARAGNINNGFNFLDADRFPAEHITRIGNKVSQPGDVVFTSKGTVGRFAFVKLETPTFVYSPQLCFWRSLKHDLVHPKFLYYWMLGREFFAQFKSVSGQTDMAEFVSLTDQRRMYITLPPLPIQHAIAHILGSLDDKIELNRRMNETLEAMARALFKDWFVEFGPVRAKMEGRQPPGLSAEVAALFPDALDTEGKPVGWEMTSFAATINLIGGGTPRTAEPAYWGGEIPWFSVVDIPRDGDVFTIDTEKKITERGLSESATRLLSPGTSIISARGTVGKCALVGVPMAMNQSCYGVIGKEGRGSYFTHFSLRYLVTELQQNTHGSVFDTITQATFQTIHVPTIPIPLTQAFDHTVSSFLQRILTNLHESHTLAALRDLLLPKLLSGELRVRDAEGVITGAR